jgi:hypothetical protein
MGVKTPRTTGFVPSGTIRRRQEEGIKVKPKPKPTPKPKDKGKKPKKGA